MIVWEQDEQGFDYGETLDAAGRLVVEGRDSRFGWLTPDGTFIGTGSAKHGRFARVVLGCLESDLEGKGWAKVDPSRQAPVRVFGEHELTDAQAAWACEHF